MNKYHPLEQENGYPEPPHPPLDLSLRDHQQRLRMCCWWIVEEWGEYFDAPDHEVASELSDILHFTVEACLLVGIKPEDFDLNSTITSTDFSLVVYVIRAAQRLKAKPWKKQYNPPDLEFIQSQFKQALISLIQLIESDGFDPHSIYFIKNKENKERIKAGY